VDPSPSLAASAQHGQIPGVILQWALRDLDGADPAIVAARPPRRAARLSRRHAAGAQPRTAAGAVCRYPGRSRVLVGGMGAAGLPDWWTYPTQCQEGHAWRPGRVIVSWQPCQCQPAREAQSRGPGHRVVECRTKGCTSAPWFDPVHNEATARLEVTSWGVSAWSLVLGLSEDVARSGPGTHPRQGVSGTRAVVLARRSCGSPRSGWQLSPEAR
jgi:hypothetical protein